MAALAPTLSASGVPTNAAGRRRGRAVAAARARSSVLVAALPRASAAVVLPFSEMLPDSAAPAAERHGRRSCWPSRSPRRCCDCELTMPALAPCAARGRHRGGVDRAVGRRLGVGVVARDRERAVRQARAPAPVSSLLQRGGGRAAAPRSMRSGGSTAHGRPPPSRCPALPVSTATVRRADRPRAARWCRLTVSVLVTSLITPSAVLPLPDRLTVEPEEPAGANSVRRSTMPSPVQPRLHRLQRRARRHVDPARLTLLSAVLATAVALCRLPDTRASSPSPVAQRCRVDADAAVRGGRHAPVPSCTFTSAWSPSASGRVEAAVCGRRGQHGVALDGVALHLEAVGRRVADGRWRRCCCLLSVALAGVEREAPVRVSVARAVRPWPSRPRCCPARSARRFGLPATRCRTVASRCSRGWPWLPTTSAVARDGERCCRAGPVRHQRVRVGRCGSSCCRRALEPSRGRSGGSRSPGRQRGLTCPAPCNCSTRAGKPKLPALLRPRSPLLATSLITPRAVLVVRQAHRRSRRTATPVRRPAASTCLDAAEARLRRLHRRAGRHVGAGTSAMLLLAVLPTASACCVLPDTLSCEPADHARRARCRCRSTVRRGGPDELRAVHQLVFDSAWSAFAPDRGSQVDVATAGSRLPAWRCCWCPSRRCCWWLSLPVAELLAACCRRPRSACPR
jgi:hypothetical protein